MTKLAEPSRSRYVWVSPIGRTRRPKEIMSQISARYKQILTLSLPIIGGMVSQNVLNLVDTAMVGTLGAAALAAVGMASFANFMCQAFLTALGNGVQAMSARRMGEGQDSIMAQPLNGGLLLAIGLGIPLTIAIYFLAPSLFPYLVEDPEVIAIGVPYWHARILGIIAVALNFAFRGYWNGVNLSKLYMRTLIVMHVVNIALNYILIFGKFGAPELGAAGAGLGTTIATWMGTLYYIYLGRKHARANGFLASLPSRETMRTMLRLSVPAGIQQTMFAAGFTSLFWIIGQVGTDELGAANVLINITLVAILPGIAMGITAASLVGQALGRGESDDAQQWGWDVVKMTLLLMGTLGLPMLLAPDLLLGLFLQEENPIALARLPLQVVGATIAFDGIGMVLMNALMGAGDTKRVMFVSVGFQWLLFLPIAYIIGPIMGYGLLEIWIAQAAYRAIQSGIFSILWRGGKWKNIKV